jgi:hypothetical protein
MIGPSDRPAVAVEPPRGCPECGRIVAFCERCGRRLAVDLLPVPAAEAAAGEPMFSAQSPSLLSQAPTGPWHSWRALPAAERRLYRGVGAAFAIVALIAGWVFLVPTPDQYLTEFYVLGERGTADWYPYQVRPNEPITVTFGIVNRERTAHEYSVAVWAQDARGRRPGLMVSSTDGIALEPGEAYEDDLSWRLSELGDDQRIDIYLLRGTDADPYRYLRLWVNVRP